MTDACLERRIYRISFIVALALAAALPKFVKAEHGSSVTFGFVGAQSGVSVSSEDGIEGLDLDSENQWSWGGSVLFDAPFNDVISAGFGAIYVNRGFDVENTTLHVERSVPTLFVPLELRFWAGKAVYVGGGAFGAIRLGEQTDRLVSGDDTLFTFSREERALFEYGITGSLGFAFPASASTRVVLEARYLHGLSDSADDDSYEEMIRDMTFTAGLRFGT